MHAPHGSAKNPRAKREDPMRHHHHYSQYYGEALDNKDVKILLYEQQQLYSRPWCYQLPQVYDTRIYVYGFVRTYLHVLLCTIWYLVLFSCSAVRLNTYYLRTGDAVQATISQPIRSGPSSPVLTSL